MHTGALRAQGAAGIFSDDFNTCELDTGLWTVVDPLGNCTVGVVGAGTDNARLSIALPAGSNHDAWTVDQSARVLQPMTGGNFQVLAKFDSVLTSGYQMQGIQVIAGPGNFMRFDVHHTGAGYRIFLVTFANNSPTVRINAAIAAGAPIHLSLQRTGNTWSPRYSYNGSTWTNLTTFNFALAQTQIGPFAGNFAINGNAPAFNALIDYFFVSDAPLVPEDGAEPGPPSILSTAVDGQGEVLVDTPAAAYYCDAEVILTATPDEGWQFDGWAGDATGTENPLTLVMAGDRSVTALFSQLPALVISNVNVVAVHDSATVTWQTSAPADSRVDYGVTADLGSFVASDALTTSHQLLLSGLQPETTYHYVVSSEDAETNYAEGPLLTFATQAESSLFSDDFNTCALDPRWMVVDPKGDAVFSLVGLATGQAQLSIQIPATAHDVWTTGADAPRVMQEVENGDFDVIARFDAPMNQTYQLQGVLVQQDATRFLRFDFYSTGSNLNIFAAVFTGGSPQVKRNVTIASGSPLYMRITRVGDTFTQRYSYDGTTWFTSVTFVHAMTVNALGPFVGNAGSSPPAFTGLIDFFFNANQPILVEDDPGVFTLATLTVDPTANGQILVDPPETEFYCGDLIEVTAVPAPNYLFVGWTGDLSGSDPSATLDMSVSRTIGALFEFDTSPLTVSDLQVQVTATTANISWTTNRLATSRVDHGLSTEYELGSLQNSTPVIQHTLLLTGLSPSTTYQFQVISEDGGEDQTAFSGNQSFTTTSADGFISDDFNNFVLNTDLWDFVNPRGVASVFTSGTNTTDACLEIQIPAGTAHDVWVTGNDSARILQPATDIDMIAEVKFQSPVLAKYQLQGILFEQDPANYLRFDFYSTGNATKLFAAVFTPAGASVKLNATIASGAPQYMRVTRVGSNWTLAYSANGSSWTTATTFAHALVVNHLGPFAGTAGPTPPAFNCKIDYFFNSQFPIQPEDGGFVEDTIPPAITQLAVSPGSEFLIVSWRTNEQATYQIQYGLDPTYSLGGQNSSTPGTQHQATLTGLEPDTTYEVRLVAIDGSGNETEQLFQASTLAPGSATGPEIVLWYGEDDASGANVQVFHSLGVPQVWANLLGNISDPDGIESFSYSLNGGPPRALSMGPDTRRLLDPGDFNVDIAISDLLPGENQVVLTAIDNLGDQSVKVVKLINEDDGSLWPTPYSIVWNGVSRLTDVVQPVDGNWTLEANSVRNLHIGYDRLLALGDLEWTEYEVTVPITLHSVNFETGYVYPSAGPGFGVLMRWPGHVDWDDGQPYYGFYPLGAIAWYRWTTYQGNRLELFGNNGIALAYDYNFSPAVGTTYMVKVRVSTAGNFDEYKMKIWPAGQSEPVAWRLQGQQSNAGNPGNGCVVLLAHEVDASFGTVTVTPGPFGGPLSDPSNIVSDDFSAPTLNTELWQFEDPIGDCSLNLVTDGANRYAEIFLPGGVDHDVWSAGNRSARLLQPSDNTDFTVLAKFDSQPTQAYQIQGILVQQDPMNFIRFDVVSQGTSVRLYAASFVNGQPSGRVNRAITNMGPTSYVRVARQGNLWIVSHSPNGTNWLVGTSFNHIMNVQHVGPFAGNAAGASSPGFTCKVDYFFNTASPVVPEDP